MHNSTFKFYLLSIIFCSVLNLNAQTSIWKKGTETGSFDLNEQTFISSVVNSKSLNASKTIEFPDEKGNRIAFKITPTQTMHPKLSEKFPEIKSYMGRSKNGAKINFTFCKAFGICGTIFKNGNKTKITPQKNGRHLFSLIEGESLTGLECSTKDEIEATFSLNNNVARDVNDSKLRKYRLALSVSGQYSETFLDGSESNDNERKNKVMIAIVNSVNRLNGIFEKDLGLRMELVANNDELIFLDQFTDPYSTGAFLNNELQTELDTTIGNENYDVGHLYHKEFRIYGNAGCIACVCTTGRKGSGYTVHSDPTSDGMNIIAAHEFGHQLGAYHTQSSDNCRSGFNSESEPGSGSTIMSYAGICPPNIQLLADDYFNHTSIRDIANWTINNSDCAEIINLTNSAPVVNAGNDKIIPISTAFVLEGDVSDSNNDALTYCWEQNDTEPVFSSSTPSSTQSAGPIFRSFPPITSSTRYFPKLEDVVSGNLTPTWEVIPDIGRDINLVLTVRDNHPNGGQVSSDALKITTVSNAGPFTVTSQNNANVVWTVGTAVTVTWNVANTNLAPINTTQVEILLSTDNGQTFNSSLITTPNDGSETFILPDVEATSEARVMIKAVDNVYYAVNSRNFSIEKAEYVLSTEASSISTCNNLEVTYNFKYTTFLGFDENVTISVENLPSGITRNLSKTSFSGSNANGESFTLTLSDLNSVPEKEFLFTLKGISQSTSVEKEVQLSLTTFDENFDTISTSTPADNATSVEADAVRFEWESVEDFNNYTIEVATDNSFTSTIISEAVLANNLTTNSLQKNSTYFWRVKYSNACGEAPFSAIKTFQTICTSPDNIRLTNTTSSTIEISWDAEGSNEWEVEYGLQGFAIGNGQKITTAINQIVVADLDSATAYDFYVRSNCVAGGLSSPSAVLLINTLANFCDGDKFYDTGGLNGPYQNNENVTTIVSPTNSTDRVKVLFESFNVESGFDYLTIYDGNTTNSNPLGSFTGNQLVGQTLTSSDDSGALTFVFSSDGTVTNNGWVASVTCEAKPNCSTPTNFETTNIQSKTTSFSWDSNSGASNWTLEYGVQGFTPGLGTEVTTSTQTSVIENLIPETNYEIYLKANCDIGGFSDIVGPLPFTTLIACNVPRGFQPQTIASRTTTLSWDNSIDTSNGWEIEYGLSGFTQGSGILQVTNNNNLTLLSLNPQTTYDAYIRADCGIEDGKSKWSSPITFTTACDVFNAPFVESFIQFNAPECWTNDNSNAWNFNTFAGGSARPIEDRNLLKNSNYVWFDGSVFNGFSTQNSYQLVSPQINIAPLTTPTLQFSVFSKNEIDNSYHKLEVYINDNAGLSAKVATIESNTEHWRDFAIDIAPLNLAPIFNIQFVVTSSGDRFAIDNDILIDEIKVTNTPPCIAPFNPSVSNTKGSNATIDWQYTQQPENWEIVYGFENFSINNGSSVLSTTNTLELANLIADTNYEFYIRSVCGTTFSSDFVGPIKFNSGCTAFMAPYEEDFSATIINQIPSCWERKTTSWNVNSERDRNGEIIPDRNPNNTPKYLKVSNSPINENHQAYVISPFITISNLSTPSIQFSLNGNYLPFVDFTTLVVDFFDGTQWNEIERVSTNTEGWKDYFIDLSHFTISGDVQFRFKQINKNQNFSSNRFLIDNIIVDELPTCFSPTDAEVTNISTTSVSLDWTANNSENLWEIEYGLSSFNLGTGTTIQIQDTPSATIGSLISNTDYDFYIRALCDTNGDNSRWNGPIKVKTRIDFCVDGKFYDSGGEFGNYSNSENTITTIAPNSSEERVRVVFNSFNLETCCDNIFIYNGPDTNAPLLGNFSIMSSNTSFSSTDASGALTFVFFSDGSITSSGWDADVYCEARPNCVIPTNFQTTTVAVTQADLTWEQSSGASEWEIEYGLFGFVRGEGTKNNYDTTSGTLTNLLPNTTYQAYIKAKCDEGGFSDVASPIIFSTLERCRIPSNFRNTLRSNTTLGFDWSSFSAREWEIEYGISGFTQGNGQTLNSNATTISINNLTSDTSYDFYLRSVCSENDKSDYISLLNISTTPNYCNTGNFTDSGGAFENYSNDENITTIIVPNDLSKVINITFDEFELESNFDFLSIYDGDNTNDGLIGQFTGNELLGRDFEATNNSGALTFVFTSDGISTSPGWNASIICKTRSNCKIPTNIVANEVTSNSALVSWGDSLPNNSWEVQYGEEGFTLDSGTINTVNDPNYQITNLKESTAYDVYVREKCGLEEAGDWAGPITFITLCDILSENKNELIKNGSFECGSFAGGWMAPNSIDSGCRVSFKVQEDSFDICSFVDNITPSNGQYAAFLSFDGQAGDLFTLSQTFTVPNEDFIIEKATLSFDFKVNYDTKLGATPTQARTLTTTFITESQEITIDTQAFASIPEENSIDKMINTDVLDILNQNKGKSITLKFIAFIPDSLSGPSKAMVDNVSLNIETTKIEPEPEPKEDEEIVKPIATPVVVIENPEIITDSSITLFPNPSDGNFKIQSQEAIPFIEVYGINGTLIKITTTSGTEKTVAISELPSGVYILKIIRESGSSEIKKIVIK